MSREVCTIEAMKRFFTFCFEPALLSDGKAGELSWDTGPLRRAEGWLVGSKARSSGWQEEGLSQG
jgi:hypothetical protein